MQLARRRPIIPPDSFSLSRRHGFDRRLDGRDGCLIWGLARRRRRRTDGVGLSVVHQSVRRPHVAVRIDMCSRLLAISVLRT